MAGSLVTVSKKLSEYKLGLVEVRWEGGANKLAAEYTCLYSKWNENHELGTVFFVHKRII
jgi:hypothetical protein